MEDNKETKLTEEEMKKEIELMQQYINSHSLSLEFYDCRREDDKKTLTDAYLHNQKNDFVKVYYAKYSNSESTAKNIKNIKQAIVNTKKQIQKIQTKDDTKIINITIIGEVPLLDVVLETTTYCDTLLNKDILGTIIDKFGTNCIFVVNNLSCYGSNTEKIWYDMMQLLKKCNYNKSFIFGSCHKDLVKQNAINEYLYIDNNTIQNSTLPEQCGFKYDYYKDFIKKNKLIPLNNIKKFKMDGRDRYISEGDIIQNQHQYYKQICDVVDKKIYTDIIKPQCKQEEIKRLYNTLDELTDKLFTKTIVEEKEVMEGGCCGKITTKRIEKEKYDNENALKWQNTFFQKNIEKLMNKDTSFQDILNLNMQLKNLKSSSVEDLPAL